MDIATIRQQHPQYNDMSDSDLADALHRKFYSDMPREEFDARVGLKSGTEAAPVQGRPNTESDAYKRSSFVDPLAQGLWAGWSDEALGLVGGAIGGAYSKMKGGSFWDGAGRGYNMLTEASRDSLDAYRRAHPGRAAAAELTGAAATMAVPGGAVARGAGAISRAKTAAGQGALWGGLYGAGAGEGVTDKVVGAGIGAGTGAALGVAAEPVVRGVGRIAGRVAAPFRAMKNPDDAAARMVAEAMRRDRSISQPRLDTQVAAWNSQPVFNVDRGGETTRDLARSAGNRSSEAWATLKTALDDRYYGQVPRIVGVVRRVVGGKNTTANREFLASMARAANRPAYRKAFSNPRGFSLWDDTLQQLAGAPEVQAAMRKASVTARSDAARKGFAPIKSPFVADKVTGALRLRNPNELPNLQFWDTVKRNLDKVGTREAKDFARVLREHLDTIVPDYKVARSGAARFFGEEDALTAGEAFVTSRMGNDEAAKALAQMSKAERQLFREGFADALVRKIMEAGDNRNVVINGMFSSPASRDRITMALGRTRAREVEAALRVEDMLNKAREAFGNSTTARQLYQIEALGGAAGAGYGYFTGDWTAAGLVFGGILARRGMSAGKAKLDQRVFKRVGELLASSDPAKVKAGIQMIARNDRILNVLRSATTGSAVSYAETR